MFERLLRSGVYALGALLCAGAVAGCASHERVPSAMDMGEMRPDQVVNFSRLYKQNCAACHGEDGGNGVSVPLANPEYLAIVDDNSLRTVIANGEPNTLMPAFARSAGGLLTDQQVNVLATGLRAKWGKPGILDGQNPPPYKADKQGDPAHGQQAYATYCASCHGANALDPGKAGSILNPTFLALMHDQTLRTIIIAGRPDLGQPDWRNDVPGHPMTDQEITDLVSWLSSQRVATPGQPYAAHP